MKARNPVEERIYRRQQAQEALFKAGAHLYDYGHLSHAHALFFASLAMVRLRQADPDDESPSIVAEVCRRVTEDRPPPPAASFVEAGAGL